MGSCHNGTARPQVAGGGNGLQTWRAAADILNKQSRTADKWCFSSLGFGLGVTTSHRKNFPRYGTFLKASDLVWGSCECGNEPSASIK